jgi:hypothetical protein
MWVIKLKCFDMLFIIFMFTNFFFQTINSAFYSKTALNYANGNKT